MGIQTITTPAGEEMVVMPRAEYDALLTEVAEAFEDGADAAAFSAALAAHRPENVLPASVSSAILSGHGRLRALRDWRGYLIEVLSQKTGIEVITLQEIEEGKRLIDRETAACVSDVLNVPFEWLTP